MEVLLPILLTLGKIFGLIVAGFLVFQIPFLKRYIDIILKVILNVLLPVYFIHSLSTGWGAAVAAGWQWIAIFFAACCIMIGLQYLLGLFLARRKRLFRTDRKKEFIILAAMHNAGYIPIPIISAVAPKPVLVYLFFYFFAFNLIFWSVTVSAIAAGGAGSDGAAGNRPKFKLNMPLIGIFAGTVIAAAGVYRFVPRIVQHVFFYTGEIALNGILVVLGAILATIDLKKIRFNPLFIGLSAVKNLLYPALFLLLFVVVRLGEMDPALAKGIKTTFVLQAAVPPATNILIAARAFGTREQEEFISNGIIHTYLFSILTLPVFLFLSAYLF